MLLYIAIISSVALLATVMFSLMLLYVITQKSTPETNAVISSNPLEDIPQLREMYVKAVANSITMTHIALFKMYADMQILDFDSISTEMKKNFEILATNPLVLKEWEARFSEYIYAKQGEVHGDDNFEEDEDDL